MRNILPLFLLLVIPFFSSAQSAREERQQKRKERISESIRMQEEGIITYKKSFLIGPKLTTDGYGLFFEIGRAKTIDRGMLYQLEITERKHPKEIRWPARVAYGTGFFYGKENFFYPVKFGAQQQFLLGNKANKNGVAVTGNVGGGFVAGLLRPYYVQVLDGYNGLKYIKYDDADKVDFMDAEIIAGGPPLNKGWNELSMVPGAYAKAALRFDYARFNEMITGVEVGLTAEYYTKKIPQMVLAEQKQFFLGAYVSLLFGKRS